MKKLMIFKSAFAGISLVISFLFLSTGTALTAQWAKTYGDPFGGGGGGGANSIQQTSDGGYIVAGVTRFPVRLFDSVDDFAVMKLTMFGTIAWQMAYGGPSSGNQPQSIQQTSDGGYIVAGTTDSFGAGGSDAWVLKLDSDGSTAWQKTYGGAGADSANSIQQTSDGGYIVAGTTDSFGAGGSDAWVLKLDSDGSIAWQKTYGGAGADSANSIQQTSDGGYIVAGAYGTSNDGSSDPWLLKLNADGTVAWQKTYGQIGYLISIQETSDGEYIAAGETSFFGARWGNSFILKVSDTGDIPGCQIIGTSNAAASDTNVIGKNTSVTGVDTNTNPQTNTATASDTNLIENTVCGFPLPTDVIANPSEINFNDTPPQASSDKVVTVTNGGSGDIMIGTITSPLAPFSKLTDNCSHLSLAPGRSCTVTIRFAPFSEQDFWGNFSVPFNDSNEGVVPILLFGTGRYITLFTPLNNTTFNACSLYSLPTFSWSVGDTFGTLELQFSSDQNFSSIPVKVKVSGTSTETVINSNIWKRVVSIPGASGGTVHWRVVGTRTNRTTAISDVRSIIIEPVQPVTNPTISPTNKNSSPQLSWNNNCNTKFKVWFGSDNNFTKNTTYTFNVKNPSDNGGVFQKALTLGQWTAIKNLVRNAIDPTIYWYIESWDGLGRHNQTDVMNFVLTE